MAEAAVSSTEATQPKSPAISFINSNKGKPLLVANNYVFKLNKTTTTTKYWICTLNGCSAKVHTDLNSQLIKTIGDHNHLAEKEKLEVREFREKVKQRAINETTPIPRIFDEECAKAMLSDATIAVLPSECEMTFPCVFGLLPNRQKSTYHFMFNELKSIALQMQLNFAPKTIMSDFEPGLLTVVSAELATVTHSSCYFHFTQAIYRAIQRVGLSTSYNDDDDVKQYCRKLMALPLLPEAIIEDTYDDLIATMPKQLKDTLNDLLEYFQQQWFVKVPISQWCVHGLNIRTNNNAEGELFLLFNSKYHFLMFNIAFHSRFNRRVQVNHPNIWSFIKILQGEENRFHHMYVQFSAGLGIRQKQAKTIAIQRRIDNLGQRYYDGAISAMEYLDALSFTVAKQKK
ncbi:unnamed protein product [Rotaria sordida]|uniref:MULE transposase domain-containing protein n=1 Tax=Rotaria sordida TaxID=392033 RepID=A0A815CJR7_9BILA|nr:unnamed protein product [Rotaria sordida]CAF1281258.1 unnamed protein product [Rotaria sordida]CAF1559845.1 unnamed protein product [Rotaria sordida]